MTIIRPMAPADLAAALAIQGQAYPAFLCEDAAAFASRLALPHHRCLAAMQGDTMLGYLLAHGWPAASPPPVGTVLEPAPAEVLYIHDLAVSPAGQGSGIGRQLVERALDMAAGNGLADAELIAVEGAAPYWERLGFRDAATSPELARKVAGYGPAARWMRRAIPPPGTPL